MQGYQTLEEAAQSLSMPVGELRKLAQKGQIRSFQDRGTLRFRIQDVQELARQRGVTSDPEEPLPGESAADFSLEIGDDDQAFASGVVPRKTGSSSTKKQIPPRDSDVRLADRDDLGFGSGTASSATRKRSPQSSASPPKPVPASDKSRAKKKSSLSGAIRSSDSDVKIVGDGSVDMSMGKSMAKEATDSEMPLYRPPGSDEGLLFTEEINLDEEIRKQEAALNPQTPPSKPQQGSPFELADVEKSQVGNYTLEEAALYLQMPVDELRQMAQKSLVRSFLDRGTLRFRMADIDELGRQRGISPSAPGTPQPRVSQLGFPAEKEGGDFFDFSLEVNEDQVDLMPRSGTGSASRRIPGSSAARKSDAKPRAGSDSDFSLEINDDQVDVGMEGVPGHKSDSKKPTPHPGPDSDVRLISDQDFSMGADSDIKLVAPESSSTRRKGGGKPKSSVSPKSPHKSHSSTPKKKSSLSSSKDVHDQPFVPSDSDSDVKIVGAGSRGDELDHTFGDSDIHLEGASGSPSANDEGMLLTEEINLDEEIRKQEEALKNQRQPSKVRRKSKLPGSVESSGMMPASPFELSESPDAASAVPPDSSDFDLKPAGESDDFNLQPSGENDDFSLELPDDFEQVSLGEDPSHALQGPTSGINLADPIDAGISLELEEDSPGASTPRPGQDAQDDSASEFELSLDDTSGEMDSQPPGSDFELGAASSSSEFELSLDDSSGEVPAQNSDSSDFEVGAAAGDSNSDSEFELSLEDSDEAPSQARAPKRSSTRMSAEEAESLEDSSSDSEFELSLDDSSEEVPSQARSADSDFEMGTSDSDFEVSEEQEVGADSGSEFELSLGTGDESSTSSDGSDSEFDLTLDDTGRPAADEDEEQEVGEAEEGKDIFETDFEVPDLDDSSESQDAFDSDTDLDSSEFEIPDDESGSVAVALDDDDYDDQAPPRSKKKPHRPAKKPQKPQRKTRQPVVDDEEFIQEESFEDLEQQDAIDQLAHEGAAQRPLIEPAPRERIQYVRPAPWGVVPTLFMFPCLVVMLFMGLIGYEMIQSQGGYKPPGLATKTIAPLAEMMGLPKFNK